MLSQCPGARRFKQPEPESIGCPYCSADLEIWTDEVTVTCPRCKKPVRKEQAMGCLDWCRYAKECVGPEIYNKYLKNKNKRKANDGV